MFMQITSILADIGKWEEASDYCDKAEINRSSQKSQSKV